MTTGKNGTLVLVYNAPDGPVAALMDAVHKLVSPATYPCSLCAVTYGAVRMRDAWRHYLDALPFPRRFYHRDGFAKAYPAVDVALPAILLDRDGAVQLLLDADTLNAQHNVDSLIAATDAALARALAL